MEPIRPLPPEVAFQIQSSKSILDLEGVVLSLVENSLDAGATKIEIEVDFQRGCCTVEDDGQGIHPSEFEQQGGLAKLYHTSKHDIASRGRTYGYMGNFLASLAVLSFLEITSCHISSSEHATLIIHHGKVVKRSASVTRPRGFSMNYVHGTCVTVRDLFGNLPVRSLQRYLRLESRNIHEKSWAALKRGIVSLLIAWIKPCVVQINDLRSKAKKTQLIGARSSVISVATKQNICELADCSINLDFDNILAILHQSSLAPYSSRQRWIPIKASTAKLSVEGCINLDPAPTRNCQFISIGIHPCSPFHGFHSIYDNINQVFANSKFGRREHNHRDVNKDMDRSSTTRDQGSLKNGNSGSKLSKAMDKWPMFVLQVKFVDEAVQGRLVTGASDSLMNSVNEILSIGVEHWLSTNCFTRHKVLSGPGAKCIALPTDFKSGKPNKSDSAGDSDQRRREAFPQSRRNAADNTFVSKRARDHQQDGHDATIRKMGRNSSADNTYFDQLSRIKSSHGSFYDKIWKSNKTVDRESVRSNRCADLGLSPSTLPSLELAGLNSHSRIASPRTRHSDNVDIRTSGVEIMQDATGEATTGSLTTAKSNETNVLDPFQGRGSAFTAHTEGRPTNEMVEWLDPATKQNFHLNMRTGILLPTYPQSGHSKSHEPRLDVRFRKPEASDTMKSSTGRPMSVSRRSTLRETSSASKERPSFLREWTNPVFVLPDEQQIPAVPRPDVQHAVKQHNDDGCAIGFKLRDSGASGHRRLTKDMLRQAQVIKQVDQKFILCKTKWDNSDGGASTLFLVDQHAASERVILEQMMAKLCLPEESDGSLFRNDGLLAPGIHTIRLENPIRFEVDATERDLLVKHAQRFAAWGILYKSRNQCHDVASHTAGVVTIHALPPSIIERCAQAPELLIDLLLSESWRSEEPGYTNDTALGNGGHPDCDRNWVARSRACPKQMLDLLNSRACRSAIMFNDELSIDECIDLIASISECAFPFICAHGRNSMVPVLTMHGCAGQADDPVPGVGIHEAVRANHFSCGHI